MIIPEHSLDKEVLERLVEEIVTRDGTDYGAQELTTEEKVSRAISALKQGSTKLVWDAETESASLISTEKANKLLREKEALDQAAKGSAD